MKYFPCGVLLLSLPSMAADLIDITDLAITPFAAPTGKDSLAFREEQRLTIGDQTWSRQQQLYQGI